MRYNQLGRSGLFVSELTLGTMTFGGDDRFRVIGEVQQRDADALVRRALDAGINMIDTADIYSGGLSETITGTSLKNLGVKRSDVLIATKAYGETGSGPNDRGASRGHLMDAVKRASRGWVPSTSTCTRCMDSTRSRRLKRRCARSTI